LNLRVFGHLISHHDATLSWTSLHFPAFIWVTSENHQCSYVTTCYVFIRFCLQYGFPVCSCLTEVSLDVMIQLEGAAFRSWHALLVVLWRCRKD